MLRNQYRYVGYVDDGHVEYQCLTCYEIIPHTGNYCSHCGTRLEKRHECRQKDVPKHEFEHPDIDWWQQRRKNYTPEENRSFFRIRGRSATFTSAKEAFDEAKRMSEKMVKPVIVYFGPEEFDLSKRFVRIENFAHVKEEIKKATIDLGLTPWQNMKDWYKNDTDKYHIPDLQSLNDQFEKDENGKWKFIQW